MSDQELLHQIDKKVDVIKTKLDQSLKTQDDHEDRIRKNEAWRWKGIGFAAAIATISSGIGMKIIHLIGK